MKKKHIWHYITYGYHRSILMLHPATIGLVWTAEQYSVRSTPGHSFTYGNENFSNHGVDYSSVIDLFQ